MALFLDITNILYILSSLTLHIQIKYCHRFSHCLSGLINPVMTLLFQTQNVQNLCDFDVLWVSDTMARETDGHMQMQLATQKNQVKLKRDI